AISSSVRLYPMNVKVDPPEGGLEKPSIVKARQLLSVDKSRLTKRLGTVKTETMHHVCRALKLSLAL
ncbi:type II toxin-antitoxin system PemK/MazF family toxin, partial [candidate division CSSED10-310 bacterium]